MSNNLSGQNIPVAASRPVATLWRHPDFMKLWVGQIVSFSGSALTRLALPLLAAVMLKATPAEMGILTAAGTAPSLIVGLMAGVWVDRYKRRTLLIVGDIGRALLLLTIPIAAAFGSLSMLQLVIVTFLAGVLSVFFDVASQSYLPSVIDPDQLVEGNSKLGLGGSITAVTGPSLAGLVIQLVTAPIAIVLDALSFIISAVCIAAIKRPEQAPEPSPASMWVQMREGLATVLRSPVLRAFAGCLATSNFTSNIFFALYILFGTRELGLDAATLGLVYGVGAIGAVFGALAASPAANRFGVGRSIVIGALLGSMEVLPVVFATPSTGAVLLVLSSLLGNFGWVIYGINATSLRQVITPMALQGRVNATLNFIIAGMLPLGALAGGALGELVGLRGAITLSAIGSLLSVLWVIFSPVRSQQRMPEPVTPPARG